MDRSKAAATVAATTKTEDEEATKVFRPEAHITRKEEEVTVEDVAMTAATTEAVIKEEGSPTNLSSCQMRSPAQSANLLPTTSSCKSKIKDWFTFTKLTLVCSNRSITWKHWRAVRTVLKQMLVSIWLVPLTVTTSGDIFSRCSCPKSQLSLWLRLQTVSKWKWSLSTCSPSTWTRANRCNLIWQLKSYNSSIN